MRPARPACPRPTACAAGTCPARSRRPAARAGCRRGWLPAPGRRPRPWARAALPGRARGRVSWRAPWRSCRVLHRCGFLCLFLAALALLALALAAQQLAGQATVGDRAAAAAVVADDAPAMAGRFGQAHAARPDGAEDLVAEVDRKSVGKGKSG